MDDFDNGVWRYVRLEGVWKRGAKEKVFFVSKVNNIMQKMVLRKKGRARVKKTMEEKFEGEQAVGVATTRERGSFSVVEGSCSLECRSYGSVE
jgi:hypothetical protein